MKTKIFISLIIVILSVNILWTSVLASPRALDEDAGYALSFDGNNDLVQLARTASMMATTWNNTKTIELWVKPNGPGVQCTYNIPEECDSIFGDKPAWWGISRGVINGQDRIWFFSFDGNTDKVGVTYTPNEWVHIAMVHNNGVLRAYKNGVEVGSVASGATLQPPAYPVLNIGGFIITPARNFTFLGQIDEVRIWNVPRTEAEIQANRLQELAGDELGLAAYYKMSDSVGTTLMDDSVNNWTGTLYDGGWNVPPDGSPPQWVPSDAFGALTPTATFTPAPPTATHTPAPPTNTPTATFTAQPPTSTPTASVTPIPPTPTATFTPAPPTATHTPAPPTSTPTATFTPQPPTSTPTASATPISPTPTSAPSGNAGYALAFDGSNDLVALAATSSMMASTWSNTKTVELWVKPAGSPVLCANNSPTRCDIIFADKPIWWGISRGVINGLDRIWVFNFDGSLDSIGVTYNPGEWMQIAVVHSGGVLAVYKNGALVTSIASGSTQQPPSAPVLHIGGIINNTSVNLTFQGRIDEVRIWNTARSAAEIQANRLQELAGDEVGLAAYYKMSDGVGTTLTDDSVNNWTGTLYDGGWGVPPDGSPPQWIPSDAFGALTPTATFTPAPPTATHTPAPPTNTPTATFTAQPPTSTPTASATPIPPTPTATFTPAPPTATHTPAPPTSTPTATFTPQPPTSTPTASATPIPPTPTSAPSGNAGYALAFDGSNDLVALAATSSMMASTWTNTKTVELWVKPAGSPVLCANNSPTRCDIIFADKPIWWGISRGVINGLDRIWVFNFDGSLDSIGVTYNPGEWMQIAVVHSGGVLAVYKNGALVTSIASGSTQQPPSAPVLHIGGIINNTSVNLTFQGQIDEVRIWNTARSAAEIQVNMQQELTGAETGLTAYYKMSDGAGTSLTDDSVNNWTGTLNDGGWGVPPDGLFPQWVESGAF